MPSGAVHGRLQAGAERRRPGVADALGMQGPSPERELEYRIPRLHSPVISRRFPETFGDFYKNKTGFQ